jgi:hypothetical protein
MRICGKWRLRPIGPERENGIGAVRARRRHLPNHVVRAVDSDPKLLRPGAASGPKGHQDTFSSFGQGFAGPKHEPCFLPAGILDLQNDLRPRLGHTFRIDAGFVRVRG